MNTKKTYRKPATTILPVFPALLMAGSGVTSAEIGYGGKDEEGIRDPEARRRSVWDEE